LFSISQIINSPALAQWRHDVSVISEVPYVDPETGHDYEAEEPPVPVEGGALVVSVGAGAVPFTPQGQALVGDYLRDLPSRYADTRRCDHTGQRAYGANLQSRGRQKLRLPPGDPVEMTRHTQTHDDSFRPLGGPRTHQT
jgi:hypothetical protein